MKFAISVWPFLTVCTFNFYGASLGVTLDVPKTVEVIENYDAVVSCNVTDGNTDSMKFYWMKDNTLVQSDQILRIPRITSSQSGTYTCRVVIYSQSYMASVAISVLYGPIWQPFTLRKYGGVAGDVLNMECVVDSNPPSSFMWLNPKNVSIDSSLISTTVTSSTTTSTILKIKSMTQSDYGTYTCKASNKVSMNSYKIELLTPGLPDSPQRCDVINATSDRIEIGCITGYKGGVADIQYNIKISSSAKQSTEKLMNPIASNQTMDYLIIDGLHAKEDYNIDVFVVNRFGTSMDSLSIFASTISGPMILNSGTMDSHKIIAIAVCLPLLAIIIISIILICFYHYKDRFESDSDQNIGITSNDFLSTQQNFIPGKNVSSTNEENYNSRLIASNSNQQSVAPIQIYDNNRANTTNSHINDTNHRYYDQLQGNPKQPNLAGCGALKPVNDNIFIKNYNNYNQRDGYIMSSGASNYNDRYGTDGEIAFVGGTTSPQIHCNPTYQESDTETSLMEISIEKLKQKWEFPRKQLHMVSKIGEGRYGRVWKATIRSNENDGTDKYVAVKTLKDNSTDDDAQNLLDELQTMEMIKFHVNIIQLIGCCTTSYPISIIMEYIAGGTLLDLLIQQQEHNGQLTIKNVLSFLHQISSAMEYICSLQLVHRCLCTQKVLLTEDLICKLGDFDKCEHFQSKRKLEKNHNVSIRWLPPESLFVLEKSMKSNVWSFGVLMWECFTLGQTPYSNMNNKEVIEFVQRGGRMDKPYSCSRVLYEIMQDCWVYYPSKRPNFEMLKNRIKINYEQASADDLIKRGEYEHNDQWNISAGEYI